MALQPQPMNHPKPCLNNRSRQLNTGKSEAVSPCLAPPMPSDKGLPNTPPTDEGAPIVLPCRFTRITNGHGSSLMARIHIGIQSASAMESWVASSSALIKHVETLNVQLDMLHVGLQRHQSGPQLVLDSVLTEGFTRAAFSHFLNQLTHDYQTVLSYARSHNIQLVPTGHSA
ncbi:MAG: hypothetical protein AAGM27_06850 [Cyanobacteria bacterium J06554_3]